MNMCFKGKEIDQISAMASPKQKITTAQQQEQNSSGTSIIICSKILKTGNNSKY